jgi:hypothetical protein
VAQLAVGTRHVCRQSLRMWCVSGCSRRFLDPSDMLLSKLTYAPVMTKAATVCSACRAWQRAVCSQRCVGYFLRLVRCLD